MGDSPGVSGQALHVITNVLRKGRFDYGRGGGNVITQIDVMWPQAKECEQPPEAGRGRDGSLLQASVDGSANAFISVQ